VVTDASSETPVTAAAPVPGNGEPVAVSRTVSAAGVSFTVTRPRVETTTDSLRACHRRVRALRWPGPSAHPAGGTPGA